MLFIYTVSLRAVGEKLFIEGRGKREEGRGTGDAVVPAPLKEKSG
jgi:hypothetical protein